MNERECRSASSSILDPSMTTYTIAYRIDILVKTRKIAIFAQTKLKAKQKPFQLCTHLQFAYVNIFRVLQFQFSHLLVSKDV